MIVFQLHRRRIRDSSEWWISWSLIQLITLHGWMGVCLCLLPAFFWIFPSIHNFCCFYNKTELCLPSLLKKGKESKNNSPTWPADLEVGVCVKWLRVCVLGHRLSLFLNCNQGLKASSLPPGHIPLFWGVSRVIGISLPIVISPCVGEWLTAFSQTAIWVWREEFWQQLMPRTPVSDLARPGPLPMSHAPLAAPESPF